MALKAGVLYSQSGQKNIGFVRWLLSGRPMRSPLDRTDLERGNLTSKLKDRLKGPDWHKSPGYRPPRGEKEARAVTDNRKED